MDLYRQEVIAPGDKASALAREICYASHGNCAAVQIVAHEKDNFRGPVGFSWKRHVLEQMLKNVWDKDGNIISWEMLEEVENDGAGGKLQFHAVAGTPAAFFGAGHEIIAMTADDCARTGRLPCILDNELQAKIITDENYHLFEALMEGYGEALKLSNLVNITGETAIMKHSITAFCDRNDPAQLILTWGASCIGLASRRLLFDRRKIKPGMLVIALLEREGYRCNGGTFFTNLMLRKYGPDRQVFKVDAEAIEFARKLTAPSTSYAKTVCRLAGWLEDGTVGEPLAKICGAAHITGGGVWGKFGELLPDGIGADLDNMPEPPAVLLEAQDLSWKYPELKLSDNDAYSTLHGGCGMMLVVEDSYDAEAVFREAEKDGLRAQVVGVTTDTARLTIASRFLAKSYLRRDLK